MQFVYSVAGDSGVMDEYEFEGDKEHILPNLYQYNLACTLYGCILHNVTSEQVRWCGSVRDVAPCDVPCLCVHALGGGCGGGGDCAGGWWPSGADISWMFVWEFSPTSQNCVPTKTTASRDHPHVNTIAGFAYVLYGFGFEQRCGHDPEARHHIQPRAAGQDHHRADGDCCRCRVRLSERLRATRVPLALVRLLYLVRSEDVPAWSC